MEYPKLCDICNQEFIFGGWCTEEYGECVCNRCGAVYRVTGESAPVCVLDEDEKRAVLNYYQKNRKPAVMKDNEGVTKEQIRMFEEWYRKDTKN